MTSSTVAKQLKLSKLPSNASAMVMAKLGQVSLKRVHQFSTEGDPALIRWHKTALNSLMRRFQLGTYPLLWISFAKGVVVTLAIQRLLG